MHRYRTKQRQSGEESGRKVEIVVKMCVCVYRREKDRERGEGRGREDGYTEVANEATAVDFPPRPLRRMREQSCNGPVINNALVSGPRVGRGGEEGKKGSGKGEEREREGMNGADTG